MEIQSPRLLLRPYALADLEAVHAFQGDADALQYEPWGPHTLETTRILLQRNAAMHANAQPWRLELAISRRLDQQVVGGCILALAAIPNGNWATLGYVITRQYWGSGYATEAAQALIQYARTQAGIVGVKAISDSHNIASQRVLEKCGMECVGMIAETKEVKGRFRDMLKYELVF
jgi:[ribosomal protein S5]-alanine N-acetyltransferase